MVEIIEKYSEGFEKFEKGVYTTVPFERIIEGNKKELIGFLETNSGEFFTARKLAGMFGFKTTGTQVELRQAISELIIDGCPIVSSAKGFSWALNDGMILNCVIELEFRQLGLQRRINALKKMIRDDKIAEDT